MAFYAYKDYTQDQEVLEAMQSVMAGNLGASLVQRQYRKNQRPCAAIRSAV